MNNHHVPPTSIYGINIKIMRTNSCVTETLSFIRQLVNPSFQPLLTLSANIFTVLYLPDFQLFSLFFTSPVCTHIYNSPAPTAQHEMVWCNPYSIFISLRSWLLSLASYHPTGARVFVIYQIRWYPICAIIQRIPQKWNI